MNKLKSFFSESDISSMFVRSTFLHERESENGANIPLYANSDSVISRLKNSQSEYLRARGEALYKQTLSSPKGSMDKNFTPEWFGFLDRAMLKAADVENEREEYPLYLVLSIFINILEEDLSVFFSNYNGDSSRIIHSAKFALYKRLSEVSSTTLYADYNEYCIINSCELSKSAYASWKTNLIQNGWYGLAFKYPVLIRFIHSSYEQIFLSTKEIISRFLDDRAELQGLIGEPNLDLLIADIEYGMSDPHNGGRSVSRVTISNQKTLIYKPKSLVNEKWFFEEIVSNFQDIIPILGKVCVIDKGAYGWAQDILSFKNEDQEGDIKYRDICKIVMLFYFLNSTDMHAENIIQLNGNFFPADLETILNAKMRQMDGDTANSGKKSWNAWGVLSTELLRYKISKISYANKGNGFSAQPAYAPFKKMYISFCPDRGITHQLYDPEKAKDIFVEENIQRAPLNYGSVPDHGTLMDDFNIVLCRLREIISSQNFLENSNLKKCKIRSIFRDTMFYERIFQRIYQPKMLSDGAILSLDLSELYLRIKDREEGEVNLRGALITEEIKQLLAGDVPLFWHYSDSNNLCSGQEILIEDFFSKCSLQELTDKIENISKVDMEEQAYLMEASLSVGDISKKVIVTGKTQPNRFSPSNIAILCNSLAEKIVSRAISSPTESAKWVSYQANQSGEIVRPAVLGDSFYSGYWGIITFLYAARKNGPYSHKLDLFLEQESRFWDMNIESYSLDGFNMGLSDLGGMLIGLSTIYDASPNSIWPIKFVEKIYDTVSVDSIEGDKFLDVIGGAAGFLMGTINVLESRMSLHLNANTTNKISDLGRTAVLNLLDKALNQGQGVAWLPIGGEPKPLLGYAHGTSGIIVALQLALEKADVFNLDKNECLKISKTIDEAHLYMESMKHKTGGWIDLRKTLPDDTPVNRSWCHGLSGVGLALLNQYNHSTNDIKEDVSLIGKLLASDYEDINYFCCGESGTADFLLEAYRTTSQERLKIFAESIASKIISDLESDRFNSIIGGIRPELFPGLFQGVSGVGYTLLRFVDSSLPSLSGYRRTAESMKSINLE